MAIFALTTGFTRAKRRKHGNRSIGALVTQISQTALATFRAAATAQGGTAPNSLYSKSLELNEVYYGTPVTVIADVATEELFVPVATAEHTQAEGTVVYFGLPFGGGVITTGAIDVAATKISLTGH
tara:strand:- start:3467 stop:3844 length:378 start_codon:yes stop_codon:yes gene_type:complete